MAIVITIGGYTSTGQIKIGSLHITDTLNSRNTARLVLQEQDGVFTWTTDTGAIVTTSDGDPITTGFRPAAGMSITIANGATTVFSGTLQTVEEEKLEGATPMLAFTLSATDHNHLADRRHYAGSHDNTTAGDIVRAIVAAKLADDDVGTTYVQDGPLLDRATFNYDKVSRCFDELAELAGFEWWIDYDKELHFAARGSVLAPFSLTDTSGNYRKMKVKTSRDKYRNRQIVRAGKDLTDELEESQKGDGEKRAFLVGFPVGEEPTILLNGSATGQTVGIRGVETGFAWYWNKDSNEITQDDGQAVLSDTDVVTIQYRGLFPIAVDAQDDEEIAAMQALEGGSGVYEDLVNEPNIDKLDMATAKADGLLRKLGTIAKSATYETDEDGAAAGQLQSIAHVGHDLSGNFLIDQVTIRDRDGKALVYTVRVLSGESMGGWEKAFRALTATGGKLAIRENEVITFMRRLKETVTVSDSVEYVSAAPVSLTNVAVSNYSESVPA